MNFYKNIIRFATVNWLKSFGVNLYYFDFFKAIRFPILIGYGTIIESLGDKHALHVENKFASFCFGLKKAPFALGNYNNYWHIGKNSSLHIEGTCRMAKGVNMKLFNDANLYIGDGFSSNANLIISCASSITFGKDCLLGWNITIMDNDGGHFILDKYSNIVLNNPQEIKVGNHVWIGAESSILKGSIIPNDCVVGFKSNICGIKDPVSYNTILVGNPAKSKKENIVWTR